MRKMPPTAAEEGSRVVIRVTAKLEDETVWDVGQDGTLDIILGEGDVPPELEAALYGMMPGTSRRVRVPLASLADFPYLQPQAPVSATFPAGTTRGDQAGYNITPGEEADPGRDLEVRGMEVGDEPLPPEEPEAGEYLLLDVQLVEVGDPGMILGREP